jgi:hypothetical protein
MLMNRPATSAQGAAAGSQLTNEHLAQGGGD